MILNITQRLVVTRALEDRTNQRQSVDKLIVERDRYHYLFKTTDTGKRVGIVCCEGEFCGEYFQLDTVPSCPVFDQLIVDEVVATTKLSLDEIKKIKNNVGVYATV